MRAIFYILLAILTLLFKRSWRWFRFRLFNYKTVIQKISNKGKNMTITLDTICKISDSFEVNAVAFSPDGKRIATGGCSSAEVSVWDIEQNKRITSCKLEYSNMPTDSVCWSASNLLASMQNGGTGIRVWDGDSFELLVYALDFFTGRCLL